MSKWNYWLVILQLILFPLPIHYLTGEAQIFEEAS